MDHKKPHSKLYDLAAFFMVFLLALGITIAIYPISILKDYMSIQPLLLLYSMTYFVVGIIILFMIIHKLDKSIDEDLRSKQIESNNRQKF